jgi:hypothetical protein
MNPYICFWEGKKFVTHLPSLRDCARFVDVNQGLKPLAIL